MLVLPSLLLQLTAQVPQALPNSHHLPIGAAMGKKLARGRKDPTMSGFHHATCALAVGPLRLRPRKRGVVLLKICFIFSTSKPSSREDFVFFQFAKQIQGRKRRMAGNRQRDQMGLQFVASESPTIDNCKDSGQWLKATEVSPVKTSKKSKK